MADLKVETLSRLVRWRINGCGNSSYLKSDPFKMGIWNWRLLVERNQWSSNVSVRLFLESSDTYKEQPPFARFVMSVSFPGRSQKPFTSEVNEMQFQTSKEFCWSVERRSEQFTIHVEFLNLKIYQLNKDGEISTIESQDEEDAPLWPGDGSKIMQFVVTQNPFHCLPRMIEEAIHFDVTINTYDGSLKAHKAILCAHSPVFKSMFHYNLKEKQSSAIYIDDISLESCQAFLHYLYGNIKLVDFWKHRGALLGAANKYGIVDLKDVCEQSLLEDISLRNVLERLEMAWLYQLDKLKKACMLFLFEFGKAYEIKEEMNNFFQQLDGESKFELFQMVLCSLETSGRASCFM